jgi:Ca-activated chloride channel family protein
VTLEEPLGLLALLSLPLFALICRLGSRRARLRAVRFSNLDLLAAVAAGERSRRQWLPVGLCGAALALLAFAIARPVLLLTRTVSTSVVVLAIDVSGSMGVQDIRPTRLAAAEQAARTFVQRLPARTRVGIVSFSTQAHVVVAPTTDGQSLADSITSLTPSGSTALGDGLAAALDLIEETTRRGGAPVPPPSGKHGPPPGRVLLLSDGANNWGLNGPLQAAETARHLGIPVDTIALGTEYGDIMIDGVPINSFGMRPDVLTLAEIARVTGGHTFSATTAPRLTGIYRRLAATFSPTVEKKQGAVVLVGSAAGLLAAAGLLSLVQRPRLP